MELVPATSAGENSDTMSVHIDPAARRVANIRTVAVKSVPMTRTMRAIGQLCYDEGTLKTLSAYVDGRIDRLYADYTGVVVNKGDHLALLYSPKLYSGQQELLLSKKARDEGPTTTLARVAETRRELYESSRQRLIELGMTERQIELLEQEGEANSRMHLCAPISGTVIEKLAVEGQYVKEGQAIYKLADLSTVWLMLELFSEDAATMRYGQKVQAEVQSLPGRKFSGRVAFIDPVVDAKKRTVGIRVVMPNEDGLLRIGDYAKATIDVVASESVDSGEALVVPRNAVLMAGDNSVVYVETEPGRFEIRRVVLGPSSGDEIVILEGVMKGEMVATSGNFLLDSQMQLAGNPSLIDPTKAVLRTESERDPEQAAEILAALAKLPDADRAAAEKQKICPVTRVALGSMGTPKKVDVNGTPVFVCCDGCRESLLEEPEKYLAILAGKAVPEDLQSPAPQSGLPELVWPPIGIPESERDLLEQLHSEAMEPKADGNEQSTSAAFAELPKEPVK
jgi:RND family efflux transporter MFP subunit